MLCHKQGTPYLNERSQCARNCTLAGFDQRKWTGSKLRQVWMGQPRRPAIDERGVIERPTEDIENEGCPAGWIGERNPFVTSVQRYSRQACDGGQRIANPLLDQCGDDLIVEAVLELELHEGRWTHEHLTQIRKRAEKE